MEVPSRFQSITSRGESPSSIGWNNTVPLEKISSVSFELFSTYEVDHLAVTNVYRTDMEGPGTVRDLKMGPQNSAQPCDTCSRNYESCPGHFGKIELPRMMHPLCVDNIILTLSCVCMTCGTLMVTKEEMEQEGILLKRDDRRLREIKNLVRRLGRTCQNHEQVPGAKQCMPTPYYLSYHDDKRKPYVKYTYEKKPEADDIRTMYADAPRGEASIHKILSSITDDDAKLLGFTASHPKTMVIDRLLVIPWCARPDVFFNRVSHADDLTSRYHGIVHSVILYNKASPDESTRSDVYADLYGKVFGLMKSDPAALKGKKKVLNDITKQIQGKEAMIRRSIMGKRVDFAGRTVVGPAAYLRADEIGIPAEIAQKLTRPFFVSELNRREMQASWDTGRIQYITKKNGRASGIRRPVNAAFRQSHPDYRLELGDYVERALQDGELVIYNRQPTLHKNGVLAAYAKIIDDRIVRINLSTTIPLHADFDGDEVNVHVPQTIEAYAEMEQLMTTSKNMLSTSMNKPTFGIVYDALSGAYLMTQPAHELEQLQSLTGQDLQDADARIAELRKRTVLDPVIYNQMMNVVVGTPQYETLGRRLKRAGIDPVSTRGVMSGAFPDGFDYMHTFFEAGTPVHVRVEDGVLVGGYLSGKTLKNVDGGIVTELTRQIGGDAAVDFLSIVQFITREYLQQHGLSVGVNDWVPTDTEFRKQVAQTVDEASLRVVSLTRKATNEIEREQEERNVRQALSNAKTKTENHIQEYFEPDNSVMIMANSGAKGSMFNTVQVGSVLGQQLVSGKRIPRNLAGNRSLPVFMPGEDSIDSRGFCRNSFASGLEPHEFFFHAQGGREGLTDTAVNTADTGSLHRQLVKTAEDVHIATDGSVRVHGGIIEALSGGDGFNAAMLSSVDIAGEKVPFFRNLQQVANQINRKYM